MSLSLGTCDIGGKSDITVRSSWIYAGNAWREKDNATIWERKDEEKGKRRPIFSVGKGSVLLAGG